MSTPSEAAMARRPKRGLPPPLPAGSSVSDPESPVQRHGARVRRRAPGSPAPISNPPGSQTSYLVSDASEGGSRGRPAEGPTSSPAYARPRGTPGTPRRPTGGRRPHSPGGADRLRRTGHLTPRSTDGGAPPG